MAWFGWIIVARIVSTTSTSFFGIKVPVQKQHSSESWGNTCNTFYSTNMMAAREDPGKHQISKYIGYFNLFKMEKGLPLVDFKSHNPAFAMVFSLSAVILKKREDPGN